MTPDRQPPDPRGTIIDAQLGRGSVSAGICQSWGNPARKEMRVAMSCDGDSCGRSVV
jgi:hypothetical protein